MNLDADKRGRFGIRGPFVRRYPWASSGMDEPSRLIRRRWGTRTDWHTMSQPESRGWEFFQKTQTESVVILEDGAGASPTVTLLRASDCLQSRVFRTDRSFPLFNREITANFSNSMTPQGQAQRIFAKQPSSLCRIR